MRKYQLDLIEQAKQKIGTMPINGTMFQDHLDNMKWAIFCGDLLRQMECLAAGERCDEH